jgi:hypothetical protein
MSYRLLKLAPGSYDVLLNGVIIASLVRYQSPTKRDTTWTAELLVDLAPEEMPEPFTAPEHTFSSLEEASLWLGASIPGPNAREGAEEG